MRLTGAMKILEDDSILSASVNLRVKEVITIEEVELVVPLTIPR